MDSNVKTAAEKLLKIADAIEKEAFGCTYFVCQECNHTASLTFINDRRKQAAEEKDIKVIGPISIDDTIACPACEGDMKYVSSEESDRFYVEAGSDKGAQAAEEIMPEIDAVPPDSDTDEGEAEEGVGPFEPVDEQDKQRKKNELEDEMKSKGVPEDEIDLSFGDDDEDEEEPLKKEETPSGDDVPPMPDPEPSDDSAGPEDPSQKEETLSGGAPSIPEPEPTEDDVPPEKGDVPPEEGDVPPPPEDGDVPPPPEDGDVPPKEGEPEEQIDKDPAEETEEETEEEPTDFQELQAPGEGEESDALVEEEFDENGAPKPKKKKDKPDDGEAAFPKEPVPKFQMPEKSKEASAEAAYWNSVARYTVG